MSEIEEIKDKLDIVEYVGRVVQLKKTGQNYKGLCPFHGEKTPSFVVSPDKQIFHCFGCNEGGDIFKFIMKTDGMEFAEALRKLAADAGVTLSRSYNPKENDKRERLFDINEEACRFFENNLQQNIGKAGLEYFKKRKLTDKTVKEFRLGFAPGGNALLKKLISEGYDEKDLVAAGVAKVKDEKLADCFRNRITFPIINSGGRVVGFSARVLDQGLPKYINTPSTEIYDKSNILYGISQAKEHIRKQDHAIVVEGNMDAIASHQAGVKNAVASSGTALTEGQLDILKKFSPNVKLAFDIDPAGDMATRRAIEKAFQKGINIKIIEIPDGKDPADVVAKDPKKWVEAVKHAVYVMDYLLEKLFTADTDKDILKKKKATREFISFITKLDDFVEKDHYTKKLADKIKVDEKAIKRALEKQKVERKISQAPEEKKMDLRELIEERLLGTVFSQERQVGYILKNLKEEDFSAPKHQNLYRELKNYYNKNNKGFELKKFHKTLKEADAEQLNILILKAEEELVNLNPDETVEDIFYLTRKLKKLKIGDEKRLLSEKIKEAEAKEEGEWAKKLMGQMQELIKKEQGI